MKALTAAEIQLIDDALVTFGNHIDIPECWTMIRSVRRKLVEIRPAPRQATKRGTTNRKEHGHGSG